MVENLPSMHKAPGLILAVKKNKEEVEEEDAMGKEEERNASENTLWTESYTVSS